MAVETDITPEEKLLRVIQKGGVTTPADVPVEPTAEPAATDGVDGPRTVKSPVSSALAGRFLRLACRLLVLVTLLLTAGGAYELVKAVPEPEVALPPPDRAFLAATETVRLPRVEDTIDQYVRRRIFGRPPTVPVVPEHERTVLRGWRAEVRDHYRLMGMADVIKEEPEGIRTRVREAIVLDAGSGRMHFLIAGKSLVIKGDHVTVRDVLPDAVVLESGEIEMTLRKRGATE